MRISDWSSDVCSSDLENIFDALFLETLDEQVGCFFHVTSPPLSPASAGAVPVVPAPGGTLRSGGSSLVRESLLQRRAVVTAGAGVVTGDASPPALASIDVEHPPQLPAHRSAQFFGAHSSHPPALIARPCRGPAHRPPPHPPQGARS